MKRIIVCCDGTWQDTNGNSKILPILTGNRVNSNVTKLFRGLKSLSSDGTLQVASYVGGVGSDGLIVNKVVGGATGYGLDENVCDAYGFISKNYQPGDTIHLFGFSRGAYTARSVAGLITQLGLLTSKGMDNFSTVWENYKAKYYRKPENVQKLHEMDNGSWITPGIKVKTIGVWDTVGSMGIPQLHAPVLGAIATGINQITHGFYDTDLSPAIEHAYQALALDETRGPFRPTLWFLPASNRTTVLKQTWFPGAHSNVGGGASDENLANIALAWMVQQMSPFMEFDDVYLREVSTSKGTWATGATDIIGVLSLIPRTPGRYNPTTKLQEMHTTNEHVHISVRARMSFKPGWYSSALNGWKWGYNGNQVEWRNGNLVMKEDEFGDLEKKFAGQQALQMMGLTG